MNNNELRETRKRTFDEYCAGGTVAVASDLRVGESAAEYVV